MDKDFPAIFMRIHENSILFFFFILINKIYRIYTSLIFRENEIYWQNFFDIKNNLIFKLKTKNREEPSREIIMNNP